MKKAPPASLTKFHEKLPPHTNSRGSPAAFSHGDRCRQRGRLVRCQTGQSLRSHVSSGIAIRFFVRSTCSQLLLGLTVYRHSISILDYRRNAVFRRVRRTSSSRTRFPMTRRYFRTGLSAFAYATAIFASAAPSINEIFTKQEQVCRFGGTYFLKCEAKFRVCADSCARTGRPIWFGLIR